MAKILIVDDEVMIREVVREYGEVFDYEVYEASNGLQAIELCGNIQFDCVILDIMMPEMDGYTACKRIKEISDVPIIMLSARSEEYDKLYGFEIGIDDYVTKPFSPKELMARVKVTIDRNKKPVTVLKNEHINVDIDSHKVFIDSEEVHLTNKEFDLLVYFMQNNNVVITRDQLLNRIWGIDFDSNERTIDTHIKMLRHHLGDYGSYIKTVRGIGYKFEEE